MLTLRIIVVVGDFGEANMENDDDDIISNGVLWDGIVHKWEDMVCTYLINPPFSVNP